MLRSRPWELLKQVWCLQQTCAQNSMSLIIRKNCRQLMTGCRSLFQNKNCHPWCSYICFHQMNMQHGVHTVNTKIQHRQSTDTEKQQNKKLQDGEEDMDVEKTATEILQSLSPEDEKRLKVLQLESDVWMSSGIKVPETITDEDWLHILQLPTRSSRMNFYKYKAVTASRQRKELEKKKKKLQERAQRLAELQQSAGTTPQYKNTYLLFVQDQTMLKHYYNNLAFSMMYGPKLVFDCGFDEHMKDREIINLVQQLMFCHAYNKVEREPFHLHLCGLHPQSKTYKKLAHAATSHFLSRAPLTATDKSYLELFPHEDIVYLSPNAPKMLKNFDHDKVYIIGAIVDQSVEKPLTMAKAKQQGIQMARLPLDKYLKWSMGKKSLTLDQMMCIMLELKKTNDWKKALQFVPQRKIHKDD